MRQMELRQFHRLPKCHIGEHWQKLYLDLRQSSKLSSFYPGGLLQSPLHAWFCIPIHMPTVLPPANLCWDCIVISLNTIQRKQSVPVGAYHLGVLIPNLSLLSMKAKHRV